MGVGGRRRKPYLPLRRRRLYRPHAAADELGPGRLRRAHPAPGTIQYNGNDKNHENVYYAEDDQGDPQLQYFVTDPWGNVYILKSVNAANDTPEEIAAAVDAAVLPEGWTKSSGYLDGDTTYVPIWSGDVAHANEFRDSADNAWTQIKWGKSGITLAAKIGDGLEIWGGNTNDLVKGNGEDNIVHGGGGNDEVRGREGDDTLTGDDGGDELRGNRGDDTLLGGAGSDTLKGGRGEDIFAFAEFKAGKDAILDFVRGKDVIDLSAIDARAATVEDDPFDFIGRLPFSGDAGELRYRVQAGDAIVKGDTDGDGQADFVLRVADTYRLDEGDFIL